MSHLKFISFVKNLKSLDDQHFFIKNIKHDLLSHGILTSLHTILLGRPVPQSARLKIHPGMNQAIKSLLYFQYNLLSLRLLRQVSSAALMQTHLKEVSNQFRLLFQCLKEF